MVPAARQAYIEVESSLQHFMKQGHFVVKHFFLGLLQLHTHTAGKF